jgi:hypothetical protein
MIKVVKLNEEQWNEIDSHKTISINYGEDGTFFNSIEEILSANKVVTLNGFPIKDTKNTTAEKIERDHSIFELPNGKYVVSSKTFNEKIHSNKYIDIHNDQIRYV